MLGQENILLTTESKKDIRFIAGVESGQNSGPPL
jgi:hypothetical protein